MAYQKLQQSGAVAVIPSDTVNIPNISQIAASGTTTSGTASKLTDTAGDFINKNVAVGDIVYAGAVATTVTAIDSATVLSVGTTVPTATAYNIYPEATNGCVLYCGGTGNINVLTAAGQTVTLSAVPTGEVLPLQVVRVNATSTTATNLIAMS
tara:strand:+ start:596 stop:1054 length:459 start_codon:yes stop_codon:yes gene_type:complete